MLTSFAAAVYRSSAKFRCVPALCAALVAIAPFTPAPAAAQAPAPGNEAPSTSLEEAAAYALAHNPSVAQAAAAVRAARARVTQRRALRMPQLGVNNYIVRQGPEVPGFAPGAPSAVPVWRWNVGVFLSQVIFDWGERAASQTAAERDAEAAAQRLAETRNNVRLVAGTTYYNVLRARELIEVADERVRSAQEQLRVSRARFESDVAPRFDVIRGEAELAAAEQELIEAKNDVSLAEATFNTALGRPVTSPVRLEMPGAVNVPEISFESLREVALQSRPRLEALRKVVQAGAATVRSRRAENKPQVTLNSTYDRPNPGGFASTEYRYSAGLVMTFPFMDSGLTRGRVREAQALADADAQVLEQARLEVELDVRQAQLDLQEAAQRAAAAAKELASAREALRVASVRYRAGVGTNLEVTDAQLAVARAGQNVANSRYDYQTAITRLEHATGTSIAHLTAGRATPQGK